MQGILLEVELAALPRNGGEESSASGAKARVVIADDEGNTVEAAVLERGEEVAPVNLGFAECSADAEDGAMT